MRWSQTFVRALHLALRLIWFGAWGALFWGVGTTAYHAFKPPQAEPTGVFTYVPVRLPDVEHRVPAATEKPDPALSEVALIRGRAELRFHNADDPYFLYGNGIYILWTLVALGIVSQLKSIFGSLAATRAFVRENASRAQLIGVFMILGHTLHALWLYVLSGHYVRLMASMEMPVTPVGFELNWQGIVTGVIVIAVAELFRQGTALSEENALTI